MNTAILDTKVFSLRARSQNKPPSPTTTPKKWKTYIRTKRYQKEESKLFKLANPGKLNTNIWDVLID